MSQFRRLSDSVMASPQISLDDIAVASEQGVTLIICNRPDDEEPGQLSSSAIRQVAGDLGIDYLSIPITGGNFGAAQIRQMSDALSAATGQVLAYCRSGTRSTFLWALATAKQGGDPDAIARTAAQAGYDIGPIRPMIAMLAAG